MSTINSTASSSSTSTNSTSTIQINGPKKPIKFYTSRTTPACRAVKMVATHLNISMDEIPMHCYIDTRTEKFRKMNPCHTLPVIDDDGYILWESRAIMQYLCNQYAPHSDLYPSDPAKRATVDRLLNFDLKLLSHSVMAVHYEFMFPSEYSSTRSEKLIAVTNALTFLEIFLINKDYVACEHLTIADISILANVTLLEISLEFDLSSYPNIWLWIQRLRNELPYYEWLTKTDDDEFRSLIQSVRDANDEWSSPLPRCAFTPSSSSQSSDHSDIDCIEEQRRQYKRLFSKDLYTDAQRILAAVLPSFRKRNNEKMDHNHNNIIDNNHDIRDHSHRTNQEFSYDDKNFKKPKDININSDNCDNVHEFRKNVNENDIFAIMSTNNLNDNHDMTKLNQKSCYCNNDNCKNRSLSSSSLTPSASSSTLLSKSLPSSLLSSSSSLNDNNKRQFQPYFDNENVLNNTTMSPSTTATNDNNTINNDNNNIYAKRIRLIIEPNTGHSKR